MRFRKTLTQGLREFEKLSTAGAVSAEDAFTLFTSYGFPFEMTQELAAERGVAVDRAAFDVYMKEHQKKSRSGAAQKFKGGLADTSAETTMLHTATHLMLAGLRKYLEGNTHQDRKSVV